MIHCDGFKKKTNYNTKILCKKKDYTALKIHFILKKVNKIQYAGNIFESIINYKRVYLIKLQ